MKMAKASKDDMERAHTLLTLLWSACEDRPFMQPRWPDTAEAIGEIFNRDDKDDLQKFYDQVRGLHEGLHRIVWGYQVLLDNCADPEADFLDFKKDIKAGLELYAEKQKSEAGKDNSNHE